MVSADYGDIFRELDRHGVELILVGETGAALQGAPLNTLNIEIVPSPDLQNVGRVLRVLDSLDAYYRLQPERRLRPNAVHLSSMGHQLLTTRSGPLDILGQIGNGRTYQDLIGHTVDINLGEGLKITVLDLETLIAVKEEVGGEKDIAALPVLRRTLAEKRRMVDRPAD